MEKQLHSGVSDEAVLKATGKEWDAWFGVLDAWKATEHTHTQIADYLYNEQSVPAWWCQMVTVGYERARGMRAKNQKADGFVVGVSRVMPYPVEKVYKAWMDAPRKKWLPEDLTITTKTENKSIRAKLLDDSRVSISFHPKRDGKVQVTIQQEKLGSEKAVERQRAFWKSALTKLVTQLG